MSKAEPTIQKYMTFQPYSIESTESLKKALTLMTSRKIRHLPVTRAGRVVGILSDRDLKLVMGFDDIDTAEEVVADICVTKPYTVDPETPLHEVAGEMASKHIGSAIVVQNGKLVGIFTATDACRALSEILLTRYHGK
jgi:acetoin utilization protein AcuB